MTPFLPSRSPDVFNLSAEGALGDAWLFFSGFKVGKIQPIFFLVAYRCKHQLSLLRIVMSFDTIFFVRVG
jgi:hypothetical protein